MVAGLEGIHHPSHQPELALLASNLRLQRIPLMDSEDVIDPAALERQTISKELVYVLHCSPRCFHPAPEL